ncbi:hypothetical protein NQ314_007433 [Rhamnusium bicolor]|uniref:Uncharacterized protein n=1 Tax=Rhamnusium bicolor TaxID=1586634 RepID=A0AAV8YP19_9CUCU|nr:hypothetical protein NQ314_007433 [Rhamnusium bicolor]
MVSVNLMCKPSNAKAILQRTLNYRNGIVQKQFSSSQNKNHYDIVIAGGGMVGTTLACTLGRNSKLSSKRILLLEANKEKAWSLPEKYSNRVVWDGISDASITFGDETTTENISYIVENDVLLAAVNNEVNNIDNVHVKYCAKVKDYQLPEYHGNGVHISLDDMEYTCELLDSIYDILSVVDPLVAQSFEPKSLQVVIKRFPILTQHITDVQTLDNECIERIFSDLFNIKTDKRNCLETNTIRSILASKQGIEAQGGCLKFAAAKEMLAAKIWSTN